MAGIFACPECGQELAVERLSPGREILCDSCSTWVEVPYLPRAGASGKNRRSSARSPWNSPLLKVAVGFAVVVMIGLFASKLIGGRVRSGQEKVLNELVASANEAESTRHFDVALREIEAALAQARSMGLEGSSRIGELEELRDRIAVNEVENRLASVEALDPDRAVGECLILAEKVAKNPSLEALAGKIEAKLASLRSRQAEADLATAKKAFDEGRDSDAFAAASKLHDHAEELSRSDSSTFQSEARAIIEAAVARKGVALMPVDGRFAAGSPEIYARILDRSRAESLRARGYLPEPAHSPWSRLWQEKAPFRATAQVVETQDDLYLQSKNRATQIDTTFELFQGDRLIWKARVVARTRELLPDLPALLGGHLATSDKRNPETERRLYEDALKQFVEQANKNFRGIPDREIVIKIR